MSTAPYDKFARFYDLEYGHKDNDLDFYLDMAEAHRSPVLEIGVGTGRVAFELAQAGYGVVGIDNSRRMLKQAERRLALQSLETAQHITLVHADMRRFSLGITFPLCIIPFRAFLHNLTVDDQLATLRCIWKHLEPNGVLAFDLFVPLYHVMAGSEWQDRLEPQELADAEAGVSIDVHVRHRPARQLLRIRNSYHQPDGKVVHADMTYRYVFRFEMEALLRECGFQVENVFGDFNRRPYNYRSGMMIFTARRCDHSTQNSAMDGNHDFTR